MREYLFRGKRADNGEWVYWDMFARATKNIDNTQSLNYDTYVVFYDDEQTPTFVIKREIGGFEYLDILPETIGEYVGLKDKNGKKVFEGDIVRVKITQTEDIKTYGNCKYKVGFIVYNEDFGLFTCKNNFMNFINWAFNDYEVIGNIHDNKELLGE